MGLNNAIVESNNSNHRISPNATEKVLTWAYLSPFGSENSPTDALSVYGEDYIASIYNGLMRRTIASNRGFVPDLASTMPIVSSDSRNWTFTLKPGLKFSDGSDLNASSVVFSYRVHLTSSIDLAYTSLVPYFSNASIYEIDNLTVQFNMTKPFAFAAGLFSKWIYSEDHFGPQYAACLADFTLAACNWNTDFTGGNLQGGSGAFMVNIYDTTNNFIELVPNPFYYLFNQINIDRIVIRTIVDATAAKAAFAAGDINIFDAQYKARATDFVALAGITEVFVDSPAFQEMISNHLHPYFGLGNYTTTGVNARTDFSLSANKSAARNIRKAMSHTIDRVFIANEITGGLSAPAATIMPKASVGWDETILPRAYDLNVAKGYMEDAGFDYTGKTFDAATGAMDVPFFEVTILSPTGNTDREQWAAKMVLELPKIGIGVREHVTGSFASLFPRTFAHPVPPPVYDEGGYDIFFLGWSINLDFDPSGFYEVEFQIPNGNNIYNYDNSTTEVAIADYVAELDAAARLPLVKRVQELLYDDQPSLPIVQPKDHWAWADNIIGLDGLSMSQRYFEWELVDIVTLFTVTETSTITDHTTETSYITTTDQNTETSHTTITDQTTETNRLTTTKIITKTEEKSVTKIELITTTESQSEGATTPISMSGILIGFVVMATITLLRSRKNKKF